MPYQALLKPPYTSDPFPTSFGPPAYDTSGSPTTYRRPPSYHSQLIPEDSPLQTIQRETLILDRFITLKVREDVFADECSLHLEGDDKFRDLFNLAQPQARLEDVVMIYGIREGVVSIPGMALPSPLPSRTTTESNVFFLYSFIFSFQFPTPKLSFPRSKCCNGRVNSYTSSHSSSPSYL